MSERTPPTLAECKRWREMAERAEADPWAAFGTPLGSMSRAQAAQATREFFAESRTAVPRLAEAYEQAIGALQCALETIRALHGPVAWEIYRDQSPEMKRIRAALPEDGE